MTNLERGEMLLKEAAFCLSEMHGDRIANTSKWLVEKRSAAFYYEQLFAQEEAQFARDGATWVYATAKGLAEHLRSP